MIIIKEIKMQEFIKKLKQGFAGVVSKSLGLKKEDMLVYGYKQSLSRIRLILADKEYNLIAELELEGQKVKEEDKEGFKFTFSDLRMNEMLRPKLGKIYAFTGANFDRFIEKPGEIIIDV
ncbi:MAG: hypothetical protein D4S01_07505 [Dehalococcoidia bacterium]|nr:MAG: hypothetical protein D4S01_07505 [Dehalococcoidia bacterium]